jgi:quercetin dioxygenase-like cupin family protein
MSKRRPKAIPNKQIENEKVIVTEWRFEPGAETGWHRHNYDYIVVPGMNGNLLLETNEGERIAKLKEGQSYFRLVGVEHNVVNANDFEFYFVEIELK